MNIQVNTEIGQATVAILPFFEAKVDSQTIRSTSGIDREISFEAKFGDVLALHHPSADRTTYLLGLGEEQHAPKWSEAFRKFAFDHHLAFGASISIQISHLPAEMSFEAMHGITLATYRIGKYKTDRSEELSFFTQDFKVVFISNETETIEALGEEGWIVGESQNEARYLVDAPGNIKSPEFLARYAQEAGKKYGFTTDIMYRHDLEEEGLQAILAVGQGSNQPPVLIKMEYKPENSPSKRAHIGLVGKGITFDTGGLSLKPSTNMHYMKSDMGGAAAVIGTMIMAARLKLPLHLVGLVPSAENCVDAASVKPGDVIGSYSGKTIEIIDTDAEGRLVLADGLAYLKNNYYPEVMIDLATLTGSSVMTLGYAAGALFSNHDDLAAQLAEAGHESQERLWRLPLWDDYKTEIHSDVADVRNFSGKPVAGAITAAKFLEVFVLGHPKWAHLDIAGVAFGDSPYAKMKSATGYGLRLLRSYMKRYTKGVDD